jgi:cAMP phosphodiesterase
MQNSCIRRESSCIPFSHRLIIMFYSSLVPNGKYKTIFPDVSVQSFPLNHGRNSLGQHSSSAFFIRHDPSQREFLFFGDVEPDALAEKPRTINVWRAAAPKIPDTLSCIFIECSWPSGRKDDLLFGHLTPEHLGNELAALAAEVVKHRMVVRRLDSDQGPARKKQRRNSATLTPKDLHQSLAGVRVYIIHCKDGDTSPPARDIIIEQCRQMVKEKGLGAEVLLALQGMNLGEEG